MSGEEIRKHVTAVLFRPFVLNIADGRRVPVIGRDFIMISPSGRSVHVYQRDDSNDWLDSLMITGISFEPVPEEPIVKPSDSNA